MSQHSYRLNEHSAELDKHTMLLAENKHAINNNSENINRVGAKLDRTKENLSHETSQVRDQLALKIEQIDKFYMDEINKMETIIRNDKSDVKGEISKSYESLNVHLNTELERQKIFVTTVTAAAQAHRETLQHRYDEKLIDIKDVCAKYFSKYEKHLLRHKEDIKTLEDRMEVWITKLIQP